MLLYCYRLLQNPSYYGLTDVDSDSVNAHLSDLLESSFNELVESGCIEIDDESKEIECTWAGKIASYYYL